MVALACRSGLIVDLSGRLIDVMRHRDALSIRRSFFLGLLCLWLLRSVAEVVLVVREIRYAILARSTRETGMLDVCNMLSERVVGFGILRRLGSCSGLFVESRDSASAASLP